MYQFIQQIRKSSSKIFILLILIFTSNDVYADTASSACEAAGVTLDSLVDIQTRAFSTIDNMLPIKIGGIEVGKTEDIDMSGISTDSTDASFLCTCEMPPPIFIRVGISISFWNNVGILDTSTIPYCFPQLGMSLSSISSGVEAGLSVLGKPGVGGANQFGARSSGGKDDQFVTAHTHFASFMNLMQIISEAIFSMCLGVNTNIAPQMSEVAFWWQYDEWGVLKNAEAFLVANPVAAAACMAESLSVSLGKKNLDLLFWCAGTWGSMYPITMNVGSGVPLTAYGILAARNIAERFQTAQLLDTTGYQMLNGYCQPIPIYFTPKSDINIYPIWPQKKNKRFPIGYPSELWGVGLDNPSNLGVMSWMVYQKRDCCYL